MPIETECLSWALYLKTKGPANKNHLNQVFLYCEEFINFCCYEYDCTQIPHLRINKSDLGKNANAYYAPDGNIYLHSGIIEFLEKISESVFDAINIESYAFLLWAISHELSHHIQKHLIIRQKFKESVIGTEFDADRLAITLVFDYIKNTRWASAKSNLEIKRSLLTTLFLPMRLKASDDMEGKTNEHPPWILRILSTATFLAYQDTNGLLSEQSKSDCKNLFGLTLSLEKVYKKSHPEDVIDLNFYAKNYAKSHFESAVNQFERIRPNL